MANGAESSRYGHSGLSPEARLGITSKRPKATSKAQANPQPAEQVREILGWLERRGSRRNIDGMARYAIRADKVFGVSVGTLRDYGKQLGRDHRLADALWRTGWYEARMLAAFVDEPGRVTPAQMDRWCRDFDNWAICDHVCFHLFDRTPHAFAKIGQWARRKEEFAKRAAFALLASVALHDKRAGEAEFASTFPLIEQAAADERNFVKKGVSWALRSVGRRSPELYAASMELAERLASSDAAPERWIGKDTIRDLCRAAVRRKLGRR